MPKNEYVLSTNGRLAFISAHAVAVDLVPSPLLVACAKVHGALWIELSDKDIPQRLETASIVRAKHFFPPSVC